MTTSTRHQPDLVLRRALRGKAIFSTLSGLLLAAASSPIGAVSPAVLFWLGLIWLFTGSIEQEVHLADNLSQR